MSELKALYRPRTLPEAFAVLEQHGDRARPLAGGTAITLSRSSRVEVLVDLSLLGLDRIEERDDGLYLGAMVTCSALRSWLRRGGPDSTQLLYEAASSVGSRILQNQVTVGGNSVMVYTWSDLPVALWCLDASFLAQGKAGSRTIGADRFFAEHPTHVLGTGELLTQILVPRPARGSGSAYKKFARDATDHGLASAAAKIVVGPDSTVLSARITLGAVRGLPQLLPDAASELLGHQPSPETVASAARVAAEEAKVTADFRAGIEYRKDLVSVVVEDALEAAARRAVAARAGGAA